MPNHYVTKMVFKKKADIQKVHEIFLKDLETNPYRMCQDIWPMPDILNHTTSPNQGMYCIDDTKFGVGIKKPIRPFTKEESAELKLAGYDNWYDWCINNWGTKWDIYRIKKHSKGIVFESAWCSPTYAIFCFFGQKYNLSFEVFGHDEGERTFVHLFTIN